MGHPFSNSYTHTKHLICNTFHKIPPPIATCRQGLGLRAPSLIGRVLTTAPRAHEEQNGHASWGGGKRSALWSLTCFVRVSAKTGCEYRAAHLQAATQYGIWLLLNEPPVLSKGRTGDRKQHAVLDSGRFFQLHGWKQAHMRTYTHWYKGIPRIQWNKSSPPHITFH